MKPQDIDRLTKTLQRRFGQNPRRHEGIAWSDVQARLDGAPDMLRTLAAMESSGGEPDVIGRDEPIGRLVFCDCSAQSPEGRRSACYDRDAWQARKEHRPPGNVLDMAGEIGIELLTEAQYRMLQQLGEFDTKTSSWILTPPEVRALGGALFCDRRYGKVFVYHNGAQSYYASRGFRGCVQV